MSILRKAKIYQHRYLKYDLTSGLVVFLVAIPLCLGVALASHAPLFSGLIAGVIGGIIVGIISQSGVSVSGPAAGMVAVVLAATAILGDFNSFLLALVFAGLLQILIGILRAGFIADYIPSNVIQGLLCAIGILLIIKQLPLTFTHPNKHVLLFSILKDGSESLSLDTFKEFKMHLNYGAAIISIISFICLWFFDHTKKDVIKNIPGPIVVVILGVLINELYVIFAPNLTQFSPNLVSIPVLESGQSFFNYFSHPNWHAWTNIHVYTQGFILAAVASLETLLNLEAAEKLDSKERYTSRNRELVAQGCGNICSGLLGGIPITSVVVRSSVNIQSGAKTKISTITHGFLILISVLFLPEWLNAIPLASLAVILIYVGYKLTKWSIYQDLYQQGWERFLPFIITVVAIVSTNLLLGIVIGLSVSSFFILKQNSKQRFDIIKERHPFGMVHRIILPQQLTFLNKSALVEELAWLPEKTQLVIDARYAKYIDPDILELLRTFTEKQAPSRDITVSLIGFKKHYDIKRNVSFIKVTTVEIQSALKPEQVLEILKEGNTRFLQETRINRSLLAEVRATSKSQHPFAVVLGCVDSRVPVETIFDMGVGDLFVIRIAGNVVNEDVLASMEFACNIAGAKLIIVLAHTRCGAIHAACNQMSATGNLEHLLDKIKISVDKEIQTTHERNGDNEAFVANVTQINKHQALKTIYYKSSVLHQLIKEEKVGLIGAIYDVKTGLVHFDAQFFNEAHKESLEILSG